MSWLKRIFKEPQSSSKHIPQVFFTNTLSGEKEIFIPHEAGTVTMYSCGPTSYAPAHFGNLRTALLSDAIARVLVGAGYRVRRVINITDFGHLVSDGDEGEDKMTKGLKREGLAITLENMRTMAEKYALQYIHDLEELNVAVEEVAFPRASDFIPQQISLIQTLEQKGYTYQTKEGVYFDTKRFPGYGKLGGLEHMGTQENSRIKQSKDKKDPADFVLWKPDTHLGWESPWGRGFPGWHIECSAMIRALLGAEIDIHTGGEDLRAIHHNNEIAQSEAAHNRPFVRYWLHGAFLNAADGGKAAKSLGNVSYLSDVVEGGYHPLALRYFFLQAHYRTPLSFSFEALGGAAAALERLWKLSRDIADESKRKSQASEARSYFLSAMRDDLATPEALGILWDALKSEEYAPEEKWGLIEDADLHLGLSLMNPPDIRNIIEEIPQDIKKLLDSREEARKDKDFDKADQIRNALLDRGYSVEDGPNGPVLTKRTL